MVFRSIYPLHFHRHGWEGRTGSACQACWASWEVDYIFIFLIKYLFSSYSGMMIWPLQWNPSLRLELNCPTKKGICCPWHTRMLSGPGEVHGESSLVLNKKRKGLKRNSKWYKSKVLNNCGHTFPFVGQGVQRKGGTGIKGHLQWRSWTPWQLPHPQGIQCRVQSFLSEDERGLLQVSLRSCSGWW